MTSIKKTFLGWFTAPPNAKKSKCFSFKKGLNSSPRFAMPPCKSQNKPLGRLPTHGQVSHDESPQFCNRKSYQERVRDCRNKPQISLVARYKLSLVPPELLCKVEKMRNLISAPPRTLLERSLWRSSRSQSQLEIGTPLPTFPHVIRRLWRHVRSASIFSP